MCVSVCVSVTSPCSTMMAKWIELTFGMDASFDLFYTVFKEIRVTPEIGVLPSGT